MIERPILFSAPMVRAINEGRKTQTRRLVVPQPDEDGLARVMRPQPEPFWRDSSETIYRCPYGLPGDRLWLREAWRTMRGFDKDSGSVIAEKCLDAGYAKPWAPIEYIADGSRVNWDAFVFLDGGRESGRYRHARFMPRWASRLTLEVTNVRVERVQDISEEDARAEGVTLDPRAQYLGSPYRFEFETLWDSLNGERASWSSNPLVWAVTFRVLTFPGAHQ